MFKETDDRNWSLALDHVAGSLVPVSKGARDLLARSRLQGSESPRRKDRYKIPLLVVAEPKSMLLNG